jgi:hypothetical protein
VAVSPLHRLDDAGPEGVGAPDLEDVLAIPSILATNL